MILHPGGSYVVLRTQVTWHERYIFEQRDIYSFTYIALSRICLSHLLIPLEGASASAHNTAQQGWWCFYFHRMSYVFYCNVSQGKFWLSGRVKANKMCLLCRWEWCPGIHLSFRFKTVELKFRGRICETLHFLLLDSVMLRIIVHWYPIGHPFL